ncbi:MAG: hypothetical protein HY720_08370 [Planctomycetes bacterium]|nr:hypothetical protein [Planctomycetota bacterium]
MRFLAPAILAFAILPLVSADIVYLKGGGQVEGRAERKGGEVVVEMPSGTLTLSADRVERIEEKETVLDLYDAKRASLSGAGAQGEYELGLWCQLNGLASRSRRHFEEAVRLDPDHEGARLELGHVRHEGVWMTSEEARKAEGLVLYHGKWLKAETVAKLLRAEEALAASRQPAEAAAKSPAGAAPAGGGGNAGGAANGGGGNGAAANGGGGPAVPGAGRRSVPKLDRSIRPTWKFLNQYFAGQWPWLGSPSYGRIYWNDGSGGSYGPLHFGPYPYDGGDFYGYGSGVFLGGGAVGGGLAQSGSLSSSSGFMGLGSSAHGDWGAASGYGGGGFALQYHYGNPTDDFHIGGTLFGSSYSSGGSSFESFGSTLHGGYNWGNGFLNFSFRP